MSYNITARNSIYLAAVFDAGMTISVKPVFWRNYCQVEIIKTSSNPQFLYVLSQKVGKGNVLKRKSGDYSWKLQGNPDVLKFLNFIEPYVEARKEHLRLLQRLIINDEPHVYLEDLVQEWKDLQNVRK
jgi:hypothetical protein